MENAAKALEIAGGVLIAILTISLFTYMFNQLSSYQAMETTNAEIEKLEAFNKKYTAYQKSILYGADVISVINMALSYNASVHEEGGSSGYSTGLDQQKQYGYFDDSNTLKINVTFKLQTDLTSTMYGITTGVSTDDADTTTSVTAVDSYDVDDYKLEADVEYDLTYFKDNWDVTDMDDVENNPILIIIPADDVYIDEDSGMSYYLKNQSETFINRIFTCKKITYMETTGRVRTLTFEEMDTTAITN